MFVVAERDQIEIAFGRLPAHQRLETVLGQNLVDRAQSIGALRMSRRGQMIQARRMREKKRRHAISWRVEGCRRRSI